MKKILFYLLVLPVYFLSLFTPRSTRVWVFGAWMGQKFADNPRYIYEYLLDNQLGIRPVWITKDKEVLCQLRNQSLPCYLAYSLSGIIIQLQAKVAVITHALDDDLAGFALDRRVFAVQTWHAISFKKIGYDDKIFTKPTSISRFNGLKKIIRKILTPYIRDDFELILANSPETKRIFMSAFRTKDENVVLTGFPRYDSLMKKVQDCKEDRVNADSSFKVLYLPTFRGAVGSEIDLFTNYGFSAHVIDEILIKNNIQLHIKLHPVNRLPVALEKEITQSKMIKVVNSLDLYEELSIYQSLITDYSSTSFDFLLLDKPIIYAPFDLERYNLEDRELYYDFDDVTPGPKVFNWNDCLEQVVKVSQGDDEYQAERKKITAHFHSFFDSNNSNRVVEEIESRLNSNSRTPEKA